MSSVPTAAIAYGFCLGNSDGWAVEEASRLGTLNLDWYCDVGDRFGCNEFITAAASHLSFHGAMKGLSFVVYGDLATAGSNSVYVALVAKDSYRDAPSNWDDNSLTVTPDGLQPPERPAWDTHLAKAIAVLGLTPRQGAPQWKILPSLN